LAQALSEPRLRVMMSMRSDFLGPLQGDKPLFMARQQIDVPPLGEDELREVVSRPAEMLGARFETERLIDIIARRAAEDSVKDVGALPLLSYTLDDMWREMQKAGDGVLRLLAPSFELDGVLADRANRFLAELPGAEDALKRVFTLKLATVRDDGEPTRRRAAHDEFSKEEWRLVSDLAGHPYRLLVTATAESGRTYAEVAHEAIFRRWDKLRQWIAEEREFLIWRAGLEAARRAWEMAPDEFESVIFSWRESLGRRSREEGPRVSKDDALLMGFPLTQAEYWLARRSRDISNADRTFIVRSRKAEQRRKLRSLAPAAVLVAAIAAGAAAWWNQNWLKEEIYALTSVSPRTAAQERALKAGDAFKECRDCPEMIVVPVRSFMMGSPDGQGADSERPPHEVTIAKPFAVAKFALTFDEWDACVAHGDCAPNVNDSGFGHGRRPAINVSWDDAQTYVKWLSRITGKDYRLLSEAEYEYAARGGTETKYQWGDDIKLGGNAMANCVDCGSQWDGKRTAPVGSFAPNGFGLYDMVGNVFQWTTDCWHDSYSSAAADGSPWTSGDCNRHVVRGGSWHATTDLLRSAYRLDYFSVNRFSALGFRVARTLSAGAGVAAAAGGGR
jgi:formylglycine-generating enzyme required for sulfatase activity